MSSSEFFSNSLSLPLLSLSPTAHITQSILFPHHMTCRLWIKASVSLTVVMGITWIIGFLMIEVEELFTLAYIFTIFVAFQGVFIFIIFVLLSKQVRENYTKWWKAKVAESDFLSKHFGDRTLGTGLVSDLHALQVTLASIKLAKRLSFGSYSWVKLNLDDAQYRACTYMIVHMYSINQVQFLIGDCRSLNN